MELALTTVVTAQSLCVEATLVPSTALWRHDDKTYSLQRLLFMAAVSRCDCSLSCGLFDLELGLASIYHAALVLRQVAAQIRGAFALLFRTVAR